MATKKQTTTDRQTQLSNRICEIQAIVGLCAFAAEARRTLGDIELAAEMDSEVEKTLSRLVDGRRSWFDYPDNLGDVLKDVNFQLQSVIALADGLGD